MVMRLTHPTTYPSHSCLSVHLCVSASAESEDVIRGSEMWGMSAGGGAGLEVMERRSNIDRAGVKEDKVKLSQVEVKDWDD